MLASFSWGDVLQSLGLLLTFVLAIVANNRLKDRQIRTEIKDLGEKHESRLEAMTQKYEERTRALHARMDDLHDTFVHKDHLFASIEILTNKMTEVVDEQRRTHERIDRFLQDELRAARGNHHD